MERGMKKRHVMERGMKKRHVMERGMKKRNIMERGMKKMHVITSLFTAVRIILLHTEYHPPPLSAQLTTAPPASFDSLAYCLQTCGRYTAL